MVREKQVFLDVLGSTLAEEAKKACEDEGMKISQIGQEELDILIGSFVQTFQDE